MKKRVNKRKSVKKRVSKRKSDKKKVTENLRENERKTNFYARASEVKRGLFLNKPMIVLLYKEALFGQIFTFLMAEYLVSILHNFGPI